MKSVVEDQTLANKVSRRSLLLSPPAGLLTGFLSNKVSLGAPVTHQALRDPLPPLPYTTFIEENLGFVLLAAIGQEEAICRCQLFIRIQRSSAVFLRLTQDRLSNELTALCAQGLLAPAKEHACENCPETYRADEAGRGYLASRLEEWELSQLASASVKIRQWGELMGG